MENEEQKIESTNSANNNLTESDDINSKNVKFTEQNQCNCRKKIERLKVDNSLQNIEIIKLQTRLLKYQKTLDHFVGAVEKLTNKLDNVVLQSANIIVGVRKH